MSKFTDLEKAMEKGLLALGAKQCLDQKVPEWKVFTINTSVGILRVTIIPKSKTESCRSRSAVLSIFSQFDSPDIAKTKTDCNSFTGKWNFHVFAANWSTGKAFAEYVLNRIKEIL